LASWGSPGTGNGQFLSAVGVATDGSGNVYVADSGRDPDDRYGEGPRRPRIQKFDANGTFLTAWGSLGSGDGQFASPSGVAADGSGHVYVADTVNHRIQQLETNGSFLTAWGGGRAGGEFTDPRGVAIDGSGNVYVADAETNRIQKFDASGTFLATWGNYGTGDGQFFYPNGVAIDESGHVYVADTF